MIDIIVYTKFLLKKFPFKGFKVKREWERYVLNRPYNHIFLCDPKDIQYKPSMSGYWKESPEEMREKLHQIFIKTLNEYGFRYTLLSGSVEERVSKINRTIEDDQNRGYFSSQTTENIYTHPFTIRRHNFSYA